MRLNDTTVPEHSSVPQLDMAKMALLNAASIFMATYNHHHSILINFINVISVKMP